MCSVVKPTFVSALLAELVLVAIRNRMSPPCLRPWRMDLVQGTSRVDDAVLVRTPARRLLSTVQSAPVARRLVLTLAVPCPERLLLMLVLMCLGRPLGRCLGAFWSGLLALRPLRRGPSSPNPGFVPVAHFRSRPCLQTARVQGGSGAVLDLQPGFGDAWARPLRSSVPRVAPV